MGRSPSQWMLSLFFIALMPQPDPAETSDRCNIIFFLTDDQRSDVLGCYGNPIIKTPTIDRLAAEGTRFENSFCEVPICAASRATILTGLSQRTHGYNFIEPPISADYIATSYPTVLKAVGYRTGFAGKYGVVYSPPGLQFDFFRVIHRNPYLHKMPDGSLRHETDLCADAAIEFIDTNPKGQPFCMSVSFNASHAEDSDHRPGYHFQWPSDTDGMYEDVEIPAPRLGEGKYFKAIPPFLQDKKNLNRQRYFWRWDTPEKYEINIRAYYRMASGIDKAIARIRGVLKAKGLDQNTIIVYSADNGMMLGDRGLAGKWNHYEESLRVPLIIYDPRLPEKQRGRIVKELVSNIDLAPTLVDAAGAKIPEVYQGRSLLPFVEGEPVKDWPTDIYCEHKFKIFNNWYGVRGERYKYAVYYDEKPAPYECLYDLKKDPDELVNLARNPEYSAELANMQSRLDSYLKTLPERTSTPPVEAPRQSPKGTFLFSGHQCEKLADVPALTARNNIKWRLDVNIAKDCRRGAILMGNRNTPKRNTTFFKITASRGVQLFQDGKCLIKLNVKFPRGCWLAVEVVKEGSDFALYVDGEKKASAKLPKSVTVNAMPCYLGGDPSVKEFARCSIRNAAVDTQ